MVSIFVGCFLKFQDLQSDYLTNNLLFDPYKGKFNGGSKSQIESISLFCLISAHEICLKQQCFKLNKKILTYVLKFVRR